MFAAPALLLLAALPLAAQTAPPPSQQPTPAAAQTATEPAPAERPIPDISTLMRQVEAHQYAAEAAEKDYIYRMSNTFDEIDGSGKVKKTASREFEVFWLNGVRVARLLKKDGKELSADEKKKEDERIDKEVAKAKERRDKADAQGHQTDSAGHDEISFARMLQLGTFSNPRRQTVNGRPTILIDFAGDPKAKSHNESEAAFKELAGTVAVDEQDKAIQHLEGHFANTFKIGGGLVADIRKDTSFKADFRKINDEAWLPEAVDGSGHARVMLFFTLNGNLHSRTSDYRKFKATSTILPGVAPAPPEPAPPVSTPPPVRP